MTGTEIIQKVLAFNLKSDSYVVFGSCPMALAGLREANDIDLLVNEETYAELLARGWKPLKKSPNDIPIVFEEFEAHNSWSFSSYQPQLKQLLQTATIDSGVPFASLEEVKKWKLSSGRPKDLEDVKLIDKSNLISK